MQREATAARLRADLDAMVRDEFASLTRDKFASLAESLMRQILPSNMRGILHCYELWFPPPFSHSGSDSLPLNGFVVL